MSVSIRPTTTLSPVVRIEECLCVEIDGTPHKGCCYCNGSGNIHFQELPEGEELNLANANWATFGNALGVLETPEDTYCGEADPCELLALIYRFDDSLSIRGGSSEYGDSGCHMVDCGLNSGQVERYISGLKEICCRAIARKAKVEWS